MLASFIKACVRIDRIRHGALVAGEIPVAGHPASIAAVGAIDLTKLVEIVLCVSRAVDTFLL